MSSITSTSFIKSSIEKFNFEGFISAKIIGYEDASIQQDPTGLGAEGYTPHKTHRSDKRHNAAGKSRLAVLIPKLMPKESGSMMLEHPPIQLDSSCIINKKKITFSKSVKSCNYLWVTESRRLTEYITLKCKDVTLKGNFKLNSKSGKLSFKGSEGQLSGITQFCPFTMAPHSTLMGTLMLDNGTISKIETPTSLSENFDFEGEILLHEGQSISVKWPSPKIGTEIVVIFLDGDPQKGCWLPYSPLA